MIRTIKGTILDLRLGSVILDVSGIGYRISIQNGRSEGLILGDTLTLHTHLAVREDSLTLYGFFTRDDLEMFEQLLDLPKIGPKSALQILSQASIELIKKAVASEDPAQLSKMSGMGKKTAEKIVIGLKDSFANVEQFGVGDRGNSDVVDALTTLGYSQKEARDAVLRLSPELTETKARVKEALRSLSKNT